MSIDILTEHYKLKYPSLPENWSIYYFKQLVDIVVIKGCIDTNGKYDLYFSMHMFEYQSLIESELHS
jgi:hypothetical protein